MKTIKVLGSGCKKCNTTMELVQAVADEIGEPIDLEKVTDVAKIMGYGVMSTPAVVIDESLVHKGSVPTKDEISAWF